MIIYCKTTCAWILQTDLHSDNSPGLAIPIQVLKVRVEVIAHYLQKKNGRSLKVAVLVNFAFSSRFEFWMNSQNSRVEFAHNGIW